MKLYLVRHGETDMNREMKICGVTDVPLNETGIGQARELAEKAKDIPFDIIFASPLIRARQTAEIVAAPHGLPVNIEPRLIETNFGIYEGASRANEEFWEIKPEPAIHFPGGESQFEVVARIYPLIRELKEKYPDKNVLLVCHGSVGRYVDAYFNDWKVGELVSWFISNCEIREYEL